MAEALTWGQNSDVHASIKAAINGGVLPTYMLLTPAEEKELSKPLVRRLNQKLLLAWQILKDESCSRCGTPAWFGRHDDPRIKFRIEKSVCGGCAEEEEESERRDKVKGKPKPHGETTYPVVYEAYKGEPLPRRDDWLAAEYEKQKVDM